MSHALKRYGFRNGRQNSYGATQGPWVDVRFLYKTTREQYKGSKFCVKFQRAPSKFYPYFFTQTLQNMHFTNHDIIELWHFMSQRDGPPVPRCTCTDKDLAMITITVSADGPMLDRDQSRYTPSQWETSLQCNDVSHWLGAYLDWSWLCHEQPQRWLLSLILSISMTRNLRNCTRHGRIITYRFVVRYCVSVRNSNTKPQQNTNKARVVYIFLGMQSLIPFLWNIIITNLYYFWTTQRDLFLKRLLLLEINENIFHSGITTVALKGHHYISFSSHYINFDLCEKKLYDYVYIIIYTCIHNYLACIHNYLYMYT